MYIGEVARLSGCSRKAIRHYEALDLIPQPARQGQYRVYNDKHLLFLAMIRQAQAVGFSLQEIHGLALKKAESGTFPLDLALQMIQAKQAQLQRQKQLINQTQKKLQALQHDLVQTYSEFKTDEIAA